MSERPLIIANLSRRAFLGVLGATGLLLAVGCAPKAPAGQKYGADSMPNGWVDDPLVFVHIDADGTVTIVCHRQEMGQGVRTSLPMVLADELEADWQRVRVRQADADQVRYGNQDTDGSRSMRHFYMPMRRAGAAARQMLAQAAAADHHGDREELKQSLAARESFGNIAFVCRHREQSPSQQWQRGAKLYLTLGGGATLFACVCRRQPCLSAC